MNNKTKLCIVLLFMIVLSSCSKSKSFYNDFIKYLNENGYSEKVHKFDDELYGTTDFFYYGDKTGIVYISNDGVIFEWMNNSDFPSAEESYKYDNGIVGILSDYGNKYCWMTDDNHISCYINDDFSADKANSNNLSKELKDAKNSIISFCKSYGKFDVLEYME